MTDGIGGFLDKGKDLAGEHPEQAEKGLDEAEQMVDEKTGGTHGDQLKKGEDLVGDKLGIDNASQ